MEEDPHLDTILTYDKHGGETMGSAREKIRAGGYDALLSAHRSHRTSLIVRFSGVPVRVGYAQAGFSWAYNRKIIRPMELHEVDRNLALVRGLGVEVQPGDRTLHAGCTRVERDEVAFLLEENDVPADVKLVGMCPGSVWATKRWTAEGFGEVGRALVEKGYRIVLLGSPDDAPVAADVASRIGENVVDAAGRTSLKALSAWMERFSLFVTNDSAPLHVAAARDVPTVAVFGATVPDQGFSPFHARSRVVEVALECRPCGPHGAKKCPKDHFRCMNDIAPQRVLAACDELLAQGGSV
jgi:heptosyltransferase-2